MISPCGGNARRGLAGRATKERGIGEQLTGNQSPASVYYKEEEHHANLYRGCRIAWHKK
jgi:hypothetical protein